MLQLEIIPIFVALSYGLLHTLQPCEDKAVFGFHTLGIAKNNAEAIKIVGIYALGLFAMDNIFGVAFSAIGLVAGLIQWIKTFVLYSWPIFSIALGMFLYIRLRKFRNVDDHLASPITLKIAMKKNMLAFFLLGLITGLPPCPFELGAYISALGVSSTAGILSGISYVMFFSIGTIMGLFVLTIVVTSFKKLVIFKERNKDIVQSIACWILIGFGVLVLVLSFFGIYLYPNVYPAPPQLT
ncbi:MAG TPA: sulfite exporter TauE/SafE family protein [Candidatus Lokiarchaeia archaeon]|nr:sulfite exporter TauE/SafE family protein [Candidatus Lokiarchaeia archaeon]